MPVLNYICVKAIKVENLVFPRDVN